jgi:hypothetical protein
MTSRNLKLLDMMVWSLAAAIGILCVFLVFGGSHG